MYYIFYLLPLEDKILFTSESREEISGNLEYIYNELISRGKRVEIQFNFRDKKTNPPTIIKFIHLAYQCATSRFIIIDDYYPRLYKLKIKKNANFMQVWHAVGAFKQFGYARLGLPGGPTSKAVSHQNYTQVVVSSQNVVDIYAKSFGVSSDIVLPLGVARTDYFFDIGLMCKSRQDFLGKYPELKEKKIIMFAPTFRGVGQMSAYYPIEWIDLSSIYKSIKDTDYVFGIKLHPYVKDRIKIPKEMRTKIIDFSDYREINDLLIMSDKLITDYSSSIFEYSLLNRKIIFYAPDLEEYKENRSFYFNYEEFIPGNVYSDFKVVIEEMLNNDFDRDRLIKFKNSFFEYEDGKSSNRIVDYILEKIGE
ncbi:putative polyribitolphosphotransferase [Lactococcus lactis subsp. lactis]|uniref:Putative polyribitolphosphotransferase n=2 Tax=Lactococcus lactis TaxID=1358 RepID=A0A2N5WFB2_LACLL|nr:putative polyribitolphosphotransferase [Lactococcus lactis subsp. lactis]